MKSEIETLQPEAVWRHFSAICKIPRPSGHLEKITLIPQHYYKIFFLST